LTLALCLRTHKRSTKGISSVIGTVFLLLIVFAVSANIFFWTITQSALFNRASRDLDEKTSDRMRENVVATNGSCAWIPGGVEIVARLANEGSVAAQLINLWVFDLTSQTYNFSNTIGSLSEANLNPGQVWEIDYSNPLIVPMNANSSDTFNAWFVTARGNTVPVTESAGVIIAQVSQGIGSIAMDFGGFFYYNVSGSYPSYTLQIWPVGKEGFYAPQRNIAFRVTLTNFDPKKRLIQLNSHSALWAVFKTSNPQQPRSSWWNIVNVDSTGKIMSVNKGSFSDITLLYGQPVFIYFASQNDLNTEGNFSPCSPYDKGSAAINLMLIGKIGTSTFGQNIPFVSIYVT
jgi:flagellin-like protein